MPTANSSLETAEVFSATGTMAAAVYRGEGAIGVEQVPVPQIGAGEILIRVEACGICPTDLKKIEYD